LLAAAPDSPPDGFGRAGARRNLPSIVGWMAGVGKDATSAAFRGERSDNDEGRGGRRRRQYFSVQPALAAGDCRHLVCALSGEGVLANKAGGAVSAPHQALSCLASRRGRGLIAARHRLGPPPRARPTVSCRRMVLVSGQLGADDRSGSGGLSRHGGPLRVHSLYWTVSDVDLAGSRLGQSSPNLRQMVCHSRCLLSAGAG